MCFCATPPRVGLKTAVLDVAKLTYETNETAMTGTSGVAGGGKVADPLLFK